MTTPATEAARQALAALPIAQASEALAQAVQGPGAFVLVAPPGAGKSTGLPELLAPHVPGKCLILQPRRAAARALAARVAEARGEALGQSVGFRVRFEAQAGSQVEFQTYGVAWAQLAQDPFLTGVGAVVVDEFHERALESDAMLAWLRTLKGSLRPDLVLGVASATLEAEALAEALRAPVVAVEARPHPVTLHHLAPRPGEPAWQTAERAFRLLLTQGVAGSVLVFMPGKGEVRRCAQALRGPAEPAGFRVLELHGGQSLAEQRLALEAPARGPCVVVATNVAETSLTIPGVVAVLDSGLERRAAYDPERDVEVLSLGRISLASATQRAGRAGRLGPGQAWRLWDRGLEQGGMPERQAPEVAVRALEGLALATAALPEAPLWFEAPNPERWALAQARLKALGALDAAGRPTALGQRLLAYPVAPVRAAAVELAPAPVRGLVAAMAAVLEAGDRQSTSDEGDLYLLGLDLARQPESKAWSHDVRGAYRRLLGLARVKGSEAQAQARVLLPDSTEDRERRRLASQAWWQTHGDRLASRSESGSYALADGRKAQATAGQPTGALLLALDLTELQGPKGRSLGMPLFLPLEAAWLPQPKQDAGVVEAIWDAAKRRVVGQRVSQQGGLSVRGALLPAAEAPAEAVAALLAEKACSGEAPVPALQEEAVQAFLRRVALARELWPDQGYPAFDAEAWAILWDDLASSSALSSWEDLSAERLLAALRDYVGAWESQRLDRAAPTHWPLPNGRRARIHYPEEGPPELSARVGDLVGLKGDVTLFEGRLPVLYDVLAPNGRTVQKTRDLDGFWAGSYLEIKKELKRRYPRHPWP